MTVEGQVDVRSTMNPCPACGARLPDGETCEERFQRILGKDFSGEGEAPGVHGLFVACYLLQHPASPHAGPAWMHPMRLGALRACLREGRHDRATFERALDAMRRDPSLVPSVPVAPVRAPLTIADLGPEAGPGHAARVLAWARAIVERAEQQG